MKEQEKKYSFKSEIVDPAVYVITRVYCKNCGEELTYCKYIKDNEEKKIPNENMYECKKCKITIPIIAKLPSLELTRKSLAEKVIEQQKSKNGETETEDVPANIKQLFNNSKEEESQKTNEKTTKTPKENQE